MSNEKCFLSDKEDCELTDVTVNGKTYWIDEEIADEHPLKKLKAMIQEKLDASEKKKEEAISAIAEAAQTLGLSKEDLGRMLLGDKGQAPVQTESPQTTVPAKASPRAVATNNNDDDWEEVDGTLPTNLKVRTNRVSNEHGQVGGGMPAHSSFTDENGKTVSEQNKKVKKLKNGIVEKSNMGTTVIRMEHRSGHEVDRMLRDIDEQGYLTRAAVSGTGSASGARTMECNLCGGSGITKIGHKECPKCGGTGIILID